MTKINAPHNVTWMIGTDFEESPTMPELTPTDAQIVADIALAITSEPLDPLCIAPDGAATPRCQTQELPPSWRRCEDDREVQGG